MSDSDSRLHTAHMAPPRTVTRRDAIRLAIAAGASLLASPFTALADEDYEASEETLAALAEAQSQADAAQEALSEIGAEIADLAARYEDTLSQVEAVNERIMEKQAEIDATEAEIAATEEKIAATEERIADTQARIRAAQDRLAARMSSAYKSGPQGMIDVLLSSSSFEEFSSNIYYLDKVSASDGELIDEVKTLKAQLEQEKASLEADRAALEDQRKVLEGQRAELEDRRAELESFKAEQETQLSAMQAKQAEVSSLFSSLSDQVSDLLAQRDAEIMEARQEAERVAAARAAAAAAASSSSSASWSPSPSPSVGNTGSQQAVVNAAYSTPSAGAGWCAAWVTYVFMNAGVGSYSGNACDMYWWYCGSSNTDYLQPGMIIAVPTHPYSSAGSIYGHVGVYVGNGQVRHNIGSVATWSLSEWIGYYGATATPRWGWLGGVALA